ncbi:MAG: bifunctional phosphoribosylaminoimidazolecarboxamide formyltransferase/IMP cyclohydrolase, partial [Acidobacteria bacterium]|nr:bifunctional phosphoribosylaminoimidazolecarboxamide formyltransferase/IMP cyclohydrolase [Acidobacteriota bacterium]
GILADRERASHLSQLNEHAITPIDLVVVNLYPFRETVSRGGSFEEVVEMIDIGGPSMVRGAAKNHHGVVVVVDPDDYPQVLGALEEGDRRVPDRLRRSLAIKAFRHTQSYDAAIAHWLEERTGEGKALFLRHAVIDLVKDFEPRYGENPHQQAALYSTTGGNGVFGGFEQLQGKELSYKNLLDVDAARRIVAPFVATAVAIVKHSNPCGVGRGTTPKVAYERALACDPLSAFGSIVASNRPVDGDMAAAMAELFVEVVIAPAVDEAAQEHFTKKKNLRVIVSPVVESRAGTLEFRSIDGGFIAQSVDGGAVDTGAWSCPTRRQPSAEEHRALEFSWNVVRYVKSNAVLLAKQDQTVGIGAGQMSRVDACRLALTKAQLPVIGAVAAADAFFPYRDGLDVLAEAGVVAVVQPGGSKRDDEVVAAADEHGMAMVFTGRRHFRH